MVTLTSEGKSSEREMCRKSMKSDMVGELYTSLGSDPLPPIFRNNWLRLTKHLAIGKTPIKLAIGMVRHGWQQWLRLRSACTVLRSRLGNVVVLGWTSINLAKRRDYPHL
ncbi:hypothetical protein M758_2G105200 [Ceratodon purpureus]|nr:hypothetical protein M758_2G105200 [Ceratodon purpureus]